MVGKDAKHAADDVVHDTKRAAKVPRRKGRAGGQWSCQWLRGPGWQYKLGGGGGGVTGV